ncbi:hypothetical protein M406DRAFT_51864, partial [Cryphonectria parasitica EP155]
YVHGKNITHRDISTRNILVAARDLEMGTIHVVLTDFGLSKEGSMLVTQCGTPEFVAPEIL